ncbi:MAG TPA: YicC/YloC family endoribonuclease [Isosphaeraceae bacterium]|nr:YicC/YloC family endoribonuclease [Isosphaeraceae bacterium]
MLLSMTGFGEARLQDERWSVAVEVRTVNNRHLKVSAKMSEPYGSLEPDLERLVRETIRRGTVQVTLRVERPRRAEDYRLNAVALASYRDQIRALLDFDAAHASIDLGPLLVLPGVVEERKPAADDPHEDWPALSAVITEALGKLQAARAEEGRAMASELLALGQAIAIQLDRVAERVPEAVDAYQKRLTERVQALVQGRGVTIEPGDLIREVAIFAERADITEEIIRLRAHLAQYIDVIHEPESSGRKLEFVVQEMGREANTIGSKANDVEISRCVVAIKGLLEKIRELIQNVE